MSSDSDEPKIVIDDDWKERVRVEREAERAARKAREQAAEATAGAEAPMREPDDFALLVSMLATQTLVALGRMPDPLQGHAVVRPDHAKQAIAMLTVLEQKTRGNLDADQAKMLEHLLHELRMLYLEVYKTPQDKPTEEDTTAKSDTKSDP